MYRPDSTVAVDVRLESDHVWFNRQQIAVLFDGDIKTIGKHINNALEEELADFSTVAKFATTAVDGKVSTCVFGNIEKFTAVITDSGIPDEYTGYILKSEVELIIA